MSKKKDQRGLFDDGADGPAAAAGELEDREVAPGELAGLLDLTPRRVRQLADDGIMVKAGRGRYLLGPSVRNYMRFLKGSKGDATSKAERESELKGYQAELAALDLAQRRAELVEVAGIRRRWVEIVNRAKVRLLAVPSRIGAQFNAVPHTPRGVAALAKVLIEEALNELTDYDGQPTGKGRPPAKRIRAPAGPGGKRVGGRKSDPKPRGQRGAGTLAN